MRCDSQLMLVLSGALVVQALTACQPIPTISAPVASATPSIIVDGEVVEDVNGNYRLTVLPGWWASMQSDAILTNYDPETHSSSLDEGDAKLQIGIGRIKNGQDFDEWIMEWVVESEGAALNPQPVTFNGFEGVTYQILGENITKVDILLVDTERILIVSRIVILGINTLSESPAINEMNQILSSLEVLPDPQQ